MLTPLTCRSIGDLKGGIAERTIDNALAQAIADLEDRGLEDAKPRKVVITIDMLKHAQDLTLVDVYVDVKLPPRRVPTTKADSKRRVIDGQPIDDLLFETHNPDNPKQPTFQVMDEAGGEVPNEA